MVSLLVVVNIQNVGIPIKKWYTFLIARKNNLKNEIFKLNSAKYNITIHIKDYKRTALIGINAH